MTAILSLFDYTGNWSMPYRQHGYNVVQVDIKHGIDIMQFDYKAIGPVHGVLAAVPCTDFTIAGNRWWKVKDADGRTDKSLALLDRTMEIIDWLEPRWWALENPVGRINQLRPEMAQHGPWYFQPCDYGDPYTKKTGLWGSFTPPLPIFVGQAWQPVEPIANPRKTADGYKSGGPLIDIYYGATSPAERAQTRSITPLGFARAFFIANP